jgi:methylglyoxal synthase
LGFPRNSAKNQKLGEKPKEFKDMTIALIAHNEMKTRMVEFAVDHEQELNKFGTILATGTTGREVAGSTTSLLKKMVRHHSGPKGGDIEIATAILAGQCDVVIFFIDPLSPHPHIDDIRVVFQACMVSDRVVMITNEMHAREFMSRTVRGIDRLKLFENISSVICHTEESNLDD